MEKTAMQQAIDKFRAEQDKLNPTKTEDYKQFQTLSFVISTLCQLRDTVEKEQIINDYCNGRMSVIEKSVIFASQYYNETYGNENT